jgi:CBS domain-containing protein
MRIAEVLAGKGNAVISVPPTASVTELVDALVTHRVGAVVVADGQLMVGIVSERDVVLALHAHGPQVLSRPVAEIMTAPVFTCSPEDALEAVSITMTDKRVRHLPVVQDGDLVGIVSIGDVVKSHIAELEHDRDQLTAYISQG